MSAARESFGAKSGPRLCDDEGVSWHLIATATTVLVTLVAWTGAATAQDRPLAEAIVVARAGGCLTEAGLLEHIGAWLRRDRIAAQLSVVVEEGEQGASFVVLRGQTARAARRFETLPEACDDRRAAVGLAIAIALDAAVLEGIAPVPEPPPERPPPVEPSPDEAPEPEPASSVHVEVAAEAQVSVEVLPHVAAGWQAGPRLVIDELVEIGLAAWVSSVAGSDLGDGRVDAQLAGGRLDLCLRRWLDGVVVLRGCVGSTAGAGIGRGRGVPLEREVVVPFVAALARVGVGLRLHELVVLELAVDGVVSLLRPRFDVVDQDGMAVHSAFLPVGGGAMSLGLAMRF